MSPAIEWMRLDNAGKIFPATSSRRNTGVFRISCDLTEPVDAIALQQALDEALIKFPHFLYILRKGLFWYYLEPSDISARCGPETAGICAQLFYRNKRNLLFRVSYYNNRINLETYHVLADGTGAMHFFQYLLCCYLSVQYPEAICRDLADELPCAPVSSYAEDSFKKYFKRGKKKVSLPLKHVYHLSGTHSENYVAVEGLIPCSKMLALAKTYDTTLTVLICALLILSIHREMMQYEERKPIVITVPVNLRKYFASDTGRNFFGNIQVAYQFQNEINELPTVIAELKKSFANQLTKDKLSGVINNFMAIERNPLVKIIPLSVKNVFLRIARHVADRGETMVVSNVGVVRMPEEAMQYIRHMSVFSSTARLQVCVCTCGDVLSVGFSSRFQETDIQRNFFRLLADMGMDICIKSNIPD